MDETLYSVHDHHGFVGINRRTSHCVVVGNRVDRELRDNRQWIYSLISIQNGYPQRGYDQMYFVLIPMQNEGPTKW